QPPFAVRRQKPAQDRPVGRQHQRSSAAAAIERWWRQDQVEGGGERCDHRDQGARQQPAEYPAVREKPGKNPGMAADGSHYPLSIRYLTRKPGIRTGNSSAAKPGTKTAYREITGNCSEQFPIELHPLTQLRVRLGFASPTLCANGLRGDTSN